MDSVDVIAASPAGLAERHRFEVAAALAGGRRVFLLEKAVEALSTVDAGDVGAVACLRGAEHLPEETLCVLDRLAGGGVPLVLSVQGQPDAARLLAARFADAVVMRQTLAEGSLIAPEGQRGASEVTLDPGDGAETHAHLVVVNGSPGVDAKVRVVADSVPNRWIERAERANRALRAANNRLARERMGIYDAAAAATVDRLRRLSDEGDQHTDFWKSEAERWAQEAEERLGWARDATRQLEEAQHSLGLLRGRRVVRFALRVSRLHPRSWGTR
jgi:hypothetical protein